MIDGLGLRQAGDDQARAWRGRKASTRTIGSSPMIASARVRIGRGTAKGITLTVATIWRASTFS